MHFQFMNHICLKIIWINMFYMNPWCGFSVLNHQLFHNLTFTQVLLSVNSIKLVPLWSCLHKRCTCYCGWFCRRKAQLEHIRYKWSFQSLHKYTWYTFLRWKNYLFKHKSNCIEYVNRLCSYEYFDVENCSNNVSLCLFICCPISSCFCTCNLVAFS